MSDVLAEVEKRKRQRKDGRRVPRQDWEYLQEAEEDLDLLIELIKQEREEHSVRIANAVYEAEAGDDL